jgi:hypothetical protein
MARAKRINIGLLDTPLRDLINAAAKIFPMGHADIVANLNPEGYEYVRDVDPEYKDDIYRWDSSNLTWGFIGADDRDIDWDDVRAKPASYNPAPHGHPLSEITDPVYTKTEVENLLPHDHNLVYAPIVHIHDDRYLTETQVATKIAVTEPMSHIHDDRYYIRADLDIALANKVALTSFNGHTGNSAVHVTTTDKDNWNGKSTLALGETSVTAFVGDKGKTAYDHSQVAHAPLDAQKNSDITIEEIEAKLVGTIATHGHAIPPGVVVKEVTCTTASTTVAKVITDESVTLVAGMFFNILFTLGCSATSPTLNINGEGARNIRLGNTNASTTTLSVTTNATVMVYFDGTFFNLLGSYRTSDSVEDLNMRLNTVQVGAATTQYKLLMMATDGKYYPTTLENVITFGKTVSTVEFAFPPKIIYYGTTTALAANAVSTTMYSEIGITQMVYNFNQSGGYILYAPIYYVGTINQNGNFVLDNSSPTSYYTQILPTEEDGKVYIYIGHVYGTNSLRLQIDTTISEFKNGAIRAYTPKISFTELIMTPDNLARITLAGSPPADTASYWFEEV